MSRYDHLIERLKAAEGYDFDLFREVVHELPISDASKTTAVSVLRRTALLQTTDKLRYPDHLKYLDHYILDLIGKASDELKDNIGTTFLVSYIPPHVDPPPWTGGKHAIAFMDYQDMRPRAAAATIPAAAFILLLENLKD